MTTIPSLAQNGVRRPCRMPSRIEEFNCERCQDSYAPTVRPHRTAPPYGPTTPTVYPPHSHPHPYIIDFFRISEILKPPPPYPPSGAPPVYFPNFQLNSSLKTPSPYQRLIKRAIARVNCSSFAYFSQISDIFDPPIALR